MWDELKSQKPGQFDPADKGGLMIPAIFTLLPNFVLIHRLQSTD